MSVKNLLTAGDFVSLLPVGLHVSLQYNANGVLEKVWTGFVDNRKVDLTAQLLDPIRTTDLVPAHIPVKNGTTWVFGCLHTHTDHYNSGVLPDCVEEELVAQFVEDPRSFQFYAAHVHSLAAVFEGALPIRNWLTNNGFTLADGCLVPIDLDIFGVLNRIWSHIRKRGWAESEISNYLIQHKGEVKYESAQLGQVKVTKIATELDEMGEVLMHLWYDSGTPSSELVPYPIAVQHNLRAKCVVTKDLTSGEIISSRFTDGKVHDGYLDTITCPRCGRTYPVFRQGHMKCPDPQCPSRQYPRICKLLKTFNLPTLSYDRCEEIMNSVGRVFGPQDILDAEEFEATSISTTIAEAMYALVDDTVPYTAVQQLASHCNNNLNSVEYYIHNPKQIIADLAVAGIECRTLSKWLSYSVNASDIISLLHHPRIQLGEGNLKFVGPQYFRNTVICITGTFRHGSEKDVAAILHSYGATVTSNYSPEVNALVVGDIQENIVGSAIRQAREHNISIWTESEFFNRFDIDSDLAANL